MVQSVLENPRKSIRFTHQQIQLLPPLNIDDGLNHHQKVFVEKTSRKINDIQNKFNKYIVKNNLSRLSGRVEFQLTNILSKHQSTIKLGQSYDQPL